MSGPLGLAAVDSKLDRGATAKAHTRNDSSTCLITESRESRIIETQEKVERC